MHTAARLSDANKNNNKNTAFHGPRRAQKCTGNSSQYFIIRLLTFNNQLTSLQNLKLTAWPEFLFNHISTPRTFLSGIYSQHMSQFLGASVRYLLLKHVFIKCLSRWSSAITRAISEATKSQRGPTPSLIPRKRLSRGWNPSVPWL